MSLFTATPKYQPVCQRCKTSDFAVLVARAGDFDIYDCRKCGPVVNKREAAK